MKKIQSLATIAVASAMSMGAAAAGVTAASAASRSKGSSVSLTGRCSKGSIGTLQVQREDTGVLSIDAGVDMPRHVSGIPWKVKAFDNGKLVANATVRTISDGSFSITRVISPKAGSNHVVFYATNLKTGETCALNGNA